MPSFLTSITGLLGFGNPLYRRFWRSRMRLTPVIIWSLIILILSGFIFAVFMALGDSEMLGESILDQAANPEKELHRIHFGTFLIFQSFVLLVMGTGAVTGGMVQERNDSTDNYIRMTPMGNVSKIVGYWLGLPVREYYLFFLTLPFSWIAMLKAGIPAVDGLILYSVLISSTALYYLVALFAGSMIRTRFAPYLVQGLVIGLNIVLPLVSKTGLVFFDYLSVRAVALDVIGQSSQGASSVPFFQWNISLAAFSVLTQISLMAVTFLVLLRYWRNPILSALSKWQSIAVYTAFIVFISGTLLPRMHNDIGGLFYRPPVQTHEQQAPVQVVTHLVGEVQSFAVLYLSSVSLSLLLLGLILLQIISPDGQAYRRGLRRAKKLGRSRLKWMEGDASALLSTMVISGLLTGCVMLMGGALLSTMIELSGATSQQSLALLAVSLVIILLGYHAETEMGNRKLTFFVILFIWVMPLLLGIVLLLFGWSTTWTVWLMQISPIGLLVSVSSLVTGVVNDFETLSGVYISCVFHIVMAIIYTAKRVRSQAKLHREIFGDAPLQT